MSNLDACKSFVAVAQHGGFSAAARHLGISKSLVSRQVSALEHEVGTQLLFRTTRQLRLTDAGVFFFDKSQKALADLQDSLNQLAEYGSGVRGRLRVLASDFFGECYIAPMLMKLQQQNPGLEVEVHIASGLFDLIAEDYDLAIGYGPMSDSSAIATKVFALPHVLVASPVYLEEHGIPRSVDELAHHKCLVSTLPACSNWQFADGDREWQVQMDGAWRSNNGPALVAAALSGLGICRLPELFLRKHITSGSLVRLLSNYDSAPLVVWATFPGAKHVPVKTRIAIDFIRQELSCLRISPQSN